MNDPHQELRNSLEQLNSEIQRTQPADETQRQHLESVQTNVQAVLDSPEAVSPAQSASLSHSLSTSLEHFEATHPALSSLVEQVLSILSNLGI